MANRIQNGYRSHMQASSPDMDMLWAKIEQRIDAKAKQDIQPVYPAQNTQQPTITVKRNNFAKYIAAAACLVAVVAGALIYINSKDDNIKTKNYETTASSSVDNVKENEQLAAEENNGAVKADSFSDKEAEAQDNISDSLTRKDKIQEDESNKSLGPKTSNDIDSVPERQYNSKTVAAFSVRNEFEQRMKSDDYISADIKTKTEMLSEFAQQLKQSGKITKLNIVYEDGFNRLEITLPDNKTESIIIK